MIYLIPFTAASLFLCPDALPQLSDLPKCSSFTFCAFIKLHSLFLSDFFLAEFSSFQLSASVSHHWSSGFTVFPCDIAKQFLLTALVNALWLYPFGFFFHFLGWNWWAFFKYALSVRLYKIVPLSHPQSSQMSAFACSTWNIFFSFSFWCGFLCRSFSSCCLSYQIWERVVFSIQTRRILQTNVYSFQPWCMHYIMVKRFLTKAVKFPSRSGEYPTCWITQHFSLLSWLSHIHSGVFNYPMLSGTTLKGSCRCLL